MPDPSLTAKGIEQCAQLALELRTKVALTQDVGLIAASPLLRTMQTVHHALHWLMDQGVPVELRAELQETTSKPCDVGTEGHQVRQDWPDFDWSKVDPVYPRKSGLYEANEEAYAKRSLTVRKWLYNCPEKCVLVVTHAGFLSKMVGGQRFQNVEYRVYKFDTDSESDASLNLVEVAQERPSDHGAELARPPS